MDSRPTLIRKHRGLSARRPGRPRKALITPSNASMGSRGGQWGARLPGSRASRSRLFREATQLKTVSPIESTARIEVPHVEIQVKTAALLRRSRPHRSDRACSDECSKTTLVTRVAVARGGKAGNGGLADRLDGSDGKAIFVLYECGAFSFQKEKE